MRERQPSSTLPHSDLENQTSIVDDHFLQEILPLAQSIPYPKGEEILMEGADARCAYFVEQGAVEVSYSMRETKITVAIIGAGNFFGEIGFFDGFSRVRNVRAIEDTVIRMFDRQTLLKVQQEDPILYAKFVTFLAQSICAKFRRIVEEREPLTAYAASLSTGRRSFEESRPLPEWFFQTPEWGLVNKMVEEVKALFFDLSYQLQKDTGPEIPEELRDKCFRMLDEFNGRLQDFKDNDFKPEIKEYMWGYVFKEIFPYYMRSRFAERAYYKPKGYAGDFLMMEMIYHNEPAGDGKLGTLTDSWCLNTTAVKAVRARRRLLAEQLHSTSQPMLARGGPIRIMNLACGSNRELFDFFTRCDYTKVIEATCVDADPDALEYTNRHVNVFPHQASIRLMSDNVVRWSIGAMRHDYGLQDIIYSSGLTDYLDRRLFQALVNRCYLHLKPGGSLIIGNFSPRNNNRGFMDHILNWRLIYRDEEELRELFVDTSFGNNVEIIAEENLVNLFAVATKVV